MSIENEVSVRSVDKTTDADAGRLQELGRSIVEIGIWVSGLESFLKNGDAFFTAARSEATADNFSREFRLVHGTLLRLSVSMAGVRSRIFAESVDVRSAAPGFTEDDIRAAADEFRSMAILSEGLIGSNRVGASQWNAWRTQLYERIRSVDVFAKLVRRSEDAGEAGLPPLLLELVRTDEELSPDRAELALILPRFGRVLMWLGVVGKMLDDDEPLKPSLLIFSKVNEQIFELTNYINNRLEKFPDQEAELFGSLDAAAYTASIELKKVYSQELAGLANIRPTPSIYARIETAHSLLFEGFQQMLASFALVLDPKVTVFDLFPSFSRKREQSVALREDLRATIELVQAAESDPTKKNIADLHRSLRIFMKSSVKFLFYKDTETVERFVEEILITRSNKDLVPLLHRFGAFLETLFGQVSHRAVLGDEAASNFG